MDHSRRRVLRALAQASIAVSDFSATMHAATEGDEGAVVYRSMSGADNAPLLVDHDAYAFLKNPPTDKMEPYFKNVSELSDTVCTLMSSMPSEKPAPKLVGTINEESPNWFGYEMCVTAIGNIKEIQNSLAYESGDGCPVCMEPLMQGSQFTTVCGHKFCTTCWNGWKAELVNRILTCPLCRQSQPGAERDDRGDDEVFFRSRGHVMIDFEDEVLFRGRVDSEEPVYR